MSEKLISVGKILNFHGIHGEAKVGFSKDRQDFFFTLKEVFVKTADGYVSLRISSTRLHKNNAVVKFKGINSINELMDYKGCLLFVTESAIRENLDEDEFLIDELVGMRVFDTNACNVGYVIGVSNNGSTDLLSVKTKSKNISLVPFVKAIVTDVKLKERKIIINNIEGLLE